MTAFTVTRNKSGSHSFPEEIADFDTLREAQEFVIAQLHDEQPYIISREEEMDSVNDAEEFAELFGAAVANDESWQWRVALPSGGAGSYTGWYEHEHEAFDALYSQAVEFHRFGFSREMEIKEGGAK